MRSFLLPKTSGLLVRGLCVLVATASLLGVARAASMAPVAAENGMVVTAQHLATEVGVDVLRRGGNAVDAAVAVGYALAVVYPAAGNLGGGGFMTLQLADGRKTFLDFREKAPLAATANMYLDAAGNVIKGSTTTGHLAVGVPGSVSGLEMALAKYGTMKRADLIAPAIRFAEQGFVLDAGDAEMFATATEAFKVDPATTRALVDAANQGGGEDNITVVLFELSAASEGAIDDTKTMPASLAASPDPDDEDTLSGLKPVSAVDTAVLSAEDVQRELARGDGESGPRARRRSRWLAVVLLLLALAVLAVLVAWGLTR